MGKIKEQWRSLDPRIRAALLEAGVILAVLLVSQEARDGLLGR